jgi:hypothetical protein
MDAENTTMPDSVYDKDMQSLVPAQVLQVICMDDYLSSFTTHNTLIIQN